MATSRTSARRRSAVAFLIGFGVVGCGGKTEPTNAPTAPEVTQQPATDPNGNPVPVVSNAGPKTASVTADAKYTQSFAEATLTDDIPDGVQLPVDMTIAGKPTGQLRLAVEAAWDAISLCSPETGKPVDQVIEIETNFGVVQVTLKPELAPNHVRNVLALAKVGYFDGLRVDRVCHQVELDAQDNPKSQLDMIKLGCPLGVGEDGRGHIGYFMHPEFRDDVTHEEGTVGFWHEVTPESAGTRMYITLGAAPLLDKSYTVVGKVSRGIDVVKKIAASPASGEGYPEVEIPKEPVVIRAVKLAKP